LEVGLTMSFNANDMVEFQTAKHQAAFGEGGRLLIPKPARKWISPAICGSAAPQSLASGMGCLLRTPCSALAKRFDKDSRNAKIRP